MAGMEEDSLTGLDLSVLLLPGFDIVYCDAVGAGGHIQLYYTSGADQNEGVHGVDPHRQSR